MQEQNKKDSRAVLSLPRTARTSLRAAELHCRRQLHPPQRGELHSKTAASPLFRSDDRARRAPRRATGQLAPNGENHAAISDGASCLFARAQTRPVRVREAVPIEEGTPGRGERNHGSGSTRAVGALPVNSRRTLRKNGCIGGRELGVCALRKHDRSSARQRCR